ncbi:MAG: TonB-dependent receptor [Flavobacteriales bacterium]|nr:TonB-dependent receptor [Flavobacteriales bacterium]
MSRYFTILFFVLTNQLFSQNNFQGKVVSELTALPLYGVEIHDKELGYLTKTDSNGLYNFTSDKKILSVYFFLDGLSIYNKSIKDSVFEQITLNPLVVSVDDVEVVVSNFETFNIRKLDDIEKMTVFSGKKTEVIKVNQAIANLATNNPRQIYNQVSGLNVFQNDDAGLQLNIGGRGLDPNRTANFNTRQNNYDISADVLGYPESYYTPPSEAIDEIQIIRGAASLQYGTQFGGLLNFVFKKPNPNKRIELISRNTIGNNNLMTNFTSLSGTINKTSYYTFINYKKGNGFRPNTGYNSLNLYGFLNYKFSAKLEISSEITYMRYLTQQAGGLTDKMFYENPLQSNRSRNWFEVDWMLYNGKLLYEPTAQTKLSVNIFGLNASRNSLGYRTNRVNQNDLGGVRDLIKGKFKNYGIESKFLHKYNLFQKSAAIVFGVKHYKSKNKSIQGPGSDGSDSDFNLYTTTFPFYKNQSEYDFPNINNSIFIENIFYVNSKLSITPGARFEFIKTESVGSYKQINLDAASNPIFDTTIFQNNINQRQFILTGVGISYKWNKSLENYSNLSQNYRSVTFSDISIVSPTYSVDPNIGDEKGYTFDFGFRGTYNDLILFDISSFLISYKDRIGFVLREFDFGGVKSVRDNVGDASLIGVESIIDINIKKLISISDQYRLNAFLNLSKISSKYTRSDQAGIEGNEIEYVPKINFKSGINLGYRKLNTSIQYSYISEQFSDASNAIAGNSSGIIGQIPDYNIVDVSMSYNINKFKIESGVNNFFNENYFSRRAVGYPGPGIIPSPKRNYYLCLEIKF